jgi:cytochrome c oxidase subunit 2
MNQPPAGSRKPSKSTIIAGLLILGVIGITVLGGLTALQPRDSITEQGDRTMLLYNVTLVVSSVIYVLVTSALIWAVFRYKRRGPAMPVQVHGSNVLELGWTIVPILILVGLFIPTLILVTDLKTPPDDDDVFLTVEAVAHQWWWEFIYPDGTRIQQTPPNYEDLTPPSLVIPTDKTVVVKVRSTDVVHSFYAPNTLYKVQAIPGTVNQLHFKVEDEGVYYGQCYQFCGLRHSDMLFLLDARTESEYQSWLGEQRRAQGIDTSDRNNVTLVEGQ